MVPIDRISWEGALKAQRGDVIAFVGGGGKTTSLLAAATELARCHRRILVSTTTKMWPPPSMPCLLTTDRDWQIKLESAFSESAVACLAGGRSDTGKLTGADPETLCRLLTLRSADVVLVEADGAAKRPLKVHGPNEPVVPTCATIVVVIAGLDALGRRVDDTVIHRFDAFSRATRVAADATVTPDLVASVLERAAGVATAPMTRGAGAPAAPRVSFVLNKAETPDLRAQGREIARLLAGSSPTWTVLLASYGRVLEVGGERVPSGGSRIGA